MLNERCDSNISLPSPTESYITALFSLLLSLITIPGNFLVCLAVLKTSNKNIRNPFNYFVLSLAIADLAVGCLTEPLAVYVHVKEASGSRVDNLELEFLHMSYFIACTTSVLSICLLGIERYVAIMSPLKFRLFFSVRRFLLLTCVVWLLSIALSSIYLFTTYTTYALVFSTNAVGWTLGVSIFTYTKILRKFNERLSNTAIHRKYRTSKTPSPSMQDGTASVVDRRMSSKPTPSPVIYQKNKSTSRNSTGTPPLDSSSSQSKAPPTETKSVQKKITKKKPSPPNPWNVKLTKTYLVIISIFLVCYFPACVVIYTMKWCTSCSCITLQYLQDLQFIIIAIQSAVNPFVYAFRFKRFRHAVMQILHCRPRSRSILQSAVYFRSNMTLTKSTMTLHSSINVSKNVSEEL